MVKRWNNEMRVGFFAAIILGIFALATIKIGDGSFLVGSGYDLVVRLENAMGLNEKTPVELAGISVGFVKGIDLSSDGRGARVVLRIRREDVKLPIGTKVFVRARGFLGDAYIEIQPGAAGGEIIGPGGEVEFGGVGGDMNLLIGQFSGIADDVKAITAAMKTMVADKDAPVARMVNNLDRFSEVIRVLVEQNQRNVDVIAKNFADLSQSLRALVAEARPDVEESMSRIASITRKVDEGKGTIGQLLNNPETAQKINAAADSLNETLGGFKKLQTQVGYHTEYLTGTEDFKHYVHLNLWPRPDEAFLLEFVEDRNASPDRVQRTSTITSGGTTSTVTAETATVERNRFRISAQLAKKFYDFTLRGGIIESRGGVGVDYNKGPVSVSASAFDFNTKNGNKPHLKFYGTVRLTPSLYFLGGADDPLNPNQSTDWFVGAGVQFVDDDIKALLAGGGLSQIRK